MESTTSKRRRKNLYWKDFNSLRRQYSNKKSKTPYTLELKGKGEVRSDGKSYYHSWHQSDEDYTAIFTGFEIKVDKDGSKLSAVVKSAHTGFAHQVELDWCDDMKSEFRKKMIEFGVPAYRMDEDEWLKFTISYDDWRDWKDKLKATHKGYNGPMWPESEGSPEGKMDPTTWIDLGYPCTYRYGFSYRGAQASRISNIEARTKSCFEKGYELYTDSTTGERYWTLCLQEYSENDMW